MRYATPIGVVLLTALGLQPANAATVPFFSHPGQIDKTLWYISNGWADGDIQSCEWRADEISVDQSNIKITLDNKIGKVRPYGCGEIHTNQRTGYGTYEAVLRSAAGSGLNTAFFTYVGPPVGVPAHDEIDFEFLGKNSRTVQVNYFVNDKSQDGTVINLGFDAAAGFHSYSFTWEPTRIRWFIDGKQVHETKPGAKIPASPGRIYLSLWSGSKIINSWLGPFTYKGPYTAEYSSVKFTPLP